MVGYAGLIQPIVIRKTGTHEQMIEAVARASVKAWLHTRADEAWTEWLAGSFGKTVRRARSAQIEAAAEHFVTSVTVGDAEAFACLPGPTTDMPAVIRKMQVSGTDAPRAGWPTPPLPSDPHVPWITVNLGANMSTGKTAAQVAHGLFAWALQQTDASLTHWQATGMRFNVIEVSETEFDTFLRHSGSSSIVIQDAGHTEVAPGTTTVLVSL